MVSQLTINQVQTAIGRLKSAENSLTSSWKDHCGCQKPGHKLRCQQCPFFREYIQKLQQEIDPNLSMGLAVIPPPEVSPPYSEEFKQRCLDMFDGGYSIQEIKDLTGVNSFGVLRRWLSDAGFYKKAQDYSSEQKQKCLDLYLEGKTPLEIESLTRISGHVIRSWVSRKGIARAKNHYSQEQQRLAVIMYSENKSYSEIEARTGVPRTMVKKFAYLAKASRKRKGKAKTYSEEFRQHCLDLLAEGQTPAQIEESLGVAADTVRRWRKQYIAKQQDN